MTSIIVSYDGTANENDALALGRIFGDAGSEVHVGYVRHSQELVSDQEAQQLLARATELYGGPLAGAHTVTNRSTPEGLASLAQQIGAEVVVFCSDSHTARGHISIGNSAQRLLEGGPVAVAIAPVGLAEAAGDLSGIVQLAADITAPGAAELVVDTAVEAFGGFCRGPSGGLVQGCRGNDRSTSVTCHNASRQIEEDRTVPPGLSMPGL